MPAHIGDTVPIFLDGLMFNGVIHSRHVDGTVTVRIESSLTHRVDFYRAEAVVHYRVMREPTQQKGEEHGKPSQHVRNRNRRSAAKSR